MTVTIYLSGGGERHRFNGYKNKSEVQLFLKEKYDISFPSRGKVDIIIIPDEVKSPSNSALKKYASDKTRIFHLNEFITWKKRRTFATIANSRVKKAEKASGKKAQKSSGKKLSGKKSSGEKSSGKKSSGKKSKKASGKKSKKASGKKSKKVRHKKNSRKTTKKTTQKTTQKTQEFNEALLWKLVLSLQWSSDHNVERVQQRLETWPLSAYLAVDHFVFEKTELLMKRFPFKQIPWATFAEVVSLGPSVYNNLTKERLLSMSRKTNEKDNFEFCFNRN